MTTDPCAMSSTVIMGPRLRGDDTPTRLTATA
jgi:hypothetical protein